MTPGQLADDLIALLESDLLTLDEVGRRIVMGKLDRFCEAHEDTPKRKIVEAAVRPPFTKAEAKRFTRRLLPFCFKAYAGKLVCDVPIEYLRYLTYPHPFVKDLKQYLTSEDGKRRIERGER